MGEHAHQWQVIPLGKAVGGPRVRVGVGAVGERAVGLEEDEVPEDFNGHQLVLGGQVNQLSY